MNNSNSFLKLFFQLLNQRNIKYCVLRNYNSLPYNTGGSDLDIWISTNDVHKVSSIMEETSTKTNCKIVSYIKNKYSPKFCFQNTTEGIQIDVFYGNIYFQDKVIFDEKTICKHIVHYNNIAILNDNFSNLVSLIKELINNGFCNSKYTQPIYNCKNYSLDYLTTNLQTFSNEFINMLYKFITEKSIETNSKFLHNLAKKSLSVNITKNKIKKLNRFFNKKPGYVIVILGTDGSGKSTIINNITPILNEGFHKGIIYNHLRPNAIPDLGVILGKKEKKEDIAIVSNPHAEQQSGLLLSLMRWAYYMIDYTLGYMKVVFPVIHLKSKVFIFDRYYYDYYIDQKRSKTKLPKLMIKLGELFLPKPDIILCLGGDPKKIYERKPETSLKEVIRQTNALRDFCRKHKKAVWIDTCSDIELSINQSMEAIILLV